MTSSDWAATLIASVVGSLHCALMCGPFLPLLAPPGTDPNDPRVKPSQALRIAVYHLGRGTAYVALGALAGLVGSGLQASASGLVMQKVIAVTMALGLGWAAFRMARPKPSLVQLKSNKPSGLLSRVQGVMFKLRQRNHANRFALSLGLASGLLPCGWLWSYLWLAATRSSVESATLTMAAFWLGTLPALTVLAWVMPSFTQKLKQHSPKLGALALALLAGWTLYERWPRAQGPAHCQSTPTLAAKAR